MIVKEDRFCLLAEFEGAIKIITNIPQNLSAIYN